MTSTEEIAGFVRSVSYEDISDKVKGEIKKRILDSIGIAIGALDEAPVDIVRKTVQDLDEEGSCTLWGSGLSASPPQAAMMNTSLTRYLDFMDSFLAPGETPHPSDNIAAIIACGEYAGASGKELIEAVGVAYELQAELAWNAPVRDRGWDHVTHTVITAAAGCAKILGLEREEARNAVGLAGTAHNALRVTRTGTIGMWKGFASANAARNAVYSCLLAENGMEGPTDLFEGEKGWEHIVAGEFEIAPGKRCEHVKRTMTKKYVAETYAQSAVEGVLELTERKGIDPEAITSIDLQTFRGAYQIIGGGEGGDRYEVRDKEQADHSLPYMLAAAILDRQMMNEQYEPDRIRGDDVQQLLRKVSVKPDEGLTERFNDGEMPAVIDIETEDGETFHIEKSDFEGHPNRPMSWESLEAKFNDLATGHYDRGRRRKIIARVKGLEQHAIDDIVALLD
jgi:2-methylcitrate dehydratase